MEGTLSMSTFSSIADTPSYMATQYTPLVSTFRKHSQELPDRHCPEPNSEAMVRALMALQRKINCLESEKQVVTPFSSDEPSAGGQMLDSTPRSPFSLLTEHEALTNKEQDTFQQHTRKVMQKEDIVLHDTPKLQPVRRTRKPTKRKVSYCSYGAEHGPVPCYHCRPTPGTHYRMNLKDVPFLLTASTSPSHSITANYQQLLASMKCHNGLCGAATAAAQKKKINTYKSLAGLKSLLASLEEEFGRLTFEHQELAQKLTMEQPAASNTSGLSEEKLQYLATQVELKAKQISIVSRQLSATDHCRKQPLTFSPTSVPVMSPRDTSLKLLRRIKDIKTTLQENDLSWD